MARKSSCDFPIMGPRKGRLSKLARFEAGVRCANLDKDIIAKAGDQGGADRQGDLHQRLLCEHARPELDSGYGAIRGAKATQYTSLEFWVEVAIGRTWPVRLDLFAIQRRLRCFEGSPRAAIERAAMFR